jgi:acetyl esterase
MLLRLRFAVGALATMLCSAPALAQIENLPLAVRDGIAALGPTLNPDMIAKTNALMAPLQASRTGLTVEKDVSYGTDPLQKLDVWQATGAQKAAPVVVFVHGGYFVRGDKGGSDNVPAYFARHGILGVNINYRLAPKVTFPAETLDLGSAVQWVRSNAARYGGDPDRIVVVGVSAGAAIVASYVLDHTIATSREGVLGAVIVSGVYGYTEEERVPSKAYYGDKVAQLAPMAHLDGAKLPLLLTMAEYDPPELAGDSHELAAALCHRDGKCPPFLWLSGHNHISQAETLDTKDDRLGRAIRGFVEQVVRLKR